MKNVHHPLLIVFFVACSLLGQAQRKQSFEVFHGKPGITKKLSELQAATLQRAMLEKEPKAKKEFHMRKYKKVGDGLEGKSFDKGELKEESTSDINSTLVDEANNTSLNIWSNFLASTFEEFPILTPPDPNGAVGSTQVITLTNNMISFFEKRSVTSPPLVSYKGVLQKTAPAQFTIPLFFFFIPVLTVGLPSDPHIRFDRLTKRWFITAIEIDPFSLVGNNNILLAVSDGDQITDETSFTFYSFPSDLLPHSKEASPPFFDYPRQGIDNNAVLIGGSAFFTHTDSCGNTFFDSLYSVGIALDKKALLRGSLIAYVTKLGSWQFNLGTGFGMLIPQGVYNDNPAAPKSFFAGINFTPGTDPADGVFLTSFMYDNKRTPAGITNTTVPVGRYQLPRFVSALGSPMPIDPLDTRLLEVSIYKNKLTGKSALWTAHAIGLDQSGAFVTESNFTLQARTASRWYEIGDIYTKPKLSQSGTLYDSAQASGRRAIHYFNPSIAASGQGHAVLGGTTSAFNRYLNAFVAGRYYGDAGGALSTPQKVTATRAIYALNFGTALFPIYIDRWGDYSQTVVDPVDNQTIWSFQEYAASDDNFGLRAIQIKAPPPATPLPLNAISNKENLWVTVKGISVDHSGFFDPGSDKGGPGYNRLSVKLTGGTGNLIASNIKFISPTEIRFRLNAKNKTAGTYTVIITNPDGQVVTTNLEITGETLQTVPFVNTMQQEEVQKYSASSSVMPNPTPGNFTLQITAVKDWTARVVLMDVSGKQLATSTHGLGKGPNQVGLSLAAYSKGTYLAAVYNQSNVLIAVQNIVKQ